VRIRDEGTVRAKAVYLALGIAPDGTKDVLGLWIEQSEDAKFWLGVMTELKSRGVDDVLLDFVTWQHRKTVAAALKAIYRASTAEAARAALEAFAASDWGRRYPPIAPAWRRNWEQVIPLFAHPPEIRRMLYTTNAIESRHLRLRKALKIRGHFPTDEAASKLIYLVLRNITRRWRQAPREWKAAMNQFAILYPDRFLISG
jgi:transposase-like protein